MTDPNPSVAANLPVALLAALCLVSSAAEARSIRVDNGRPDLDGNPMWEQNGGNVLDDVGDTGKVTLPFSFFGASTLFVSDRGVVSFGAPITDASGLATATAPFLVPLFLTDNSGHMNIGFDWGGQTRNCVPDPGDCGPDGESSGPTLQDLVQIDPDGNQLAEAAFRITWNITDEARNPSTAMQLVVWSLLDGNYVVEFNYDFVGFNPGGSFVGFNLGPGHTFDASTVSDYVDLTQCQPGFEETDSCQPGNNYVGPGFPPGALRDAFFAPDVNNGDIGGRAVFFIAGDGVTTVPEPGTLALLSAGLLGMILTKRRREAAGPVA